MRIALAGFTHEANCFCPVPATQESFAARNYAVGPELIAQAQGTRTEPAGALDVLAAGHDVEVVPLLLARAGSSGPITAETYQRIRDDLLGRLRAALPVDGVLLVLHGAMMAEGADDASGELLDHVREAVGASVPIVGTLDLHANVTPRMARAATALVGYHTAPHVDMYEAGETAARILLGAVRGDLRPTAALVRLPLLVPAENARHTDGPLSEVINRALAWEREGRIKHGGVFAVQPWLDAPDVGCSVYVVTDATPEDAVGYAQELASMFWERRQAFVPELCSPDEAVRLALAGTPRRVILCDSADAPSSGSTGDNTAILKAVLDAQPREPVLLNIVDAEAAHAAARAGVGAQIRLSLGGKLAPEYAQPVTVDAYVKTISDGEFVFKGPGMRGVVHRMGLATVLSIGSIRLAVMSRGITQWDPELYRSLGLEPGDARITQVKSPAAFRAAYGGLYDEIIIVDAPGAASPDLTALPWRRLRRPIYPLDPDLVFDVAASTWQKGPDR
jgi:microcystin degradation protein MlrC